MEYEMIDPEQSKLSLRLIVTILLIVLAVGMVSLVGHFSKTISTVEAPGPKAPSPVSAPIAPPGIALSSPASVQKIETPPPPSVSNVAPGVKKSAEEAPKEKAPVGEVTAKEIPLEKPVAEKAREKPHVRERARGGYALQFGLFSSRKNAERMAALLGKKTLRPVMETLVLAGPYPDREAALKEKTPGAVLLVQQGKYALQFGNFESFGRAQRLAEALKKKGIAARLETRVLAGRFESRKKALDAVRKIGLPAVVVKR